MESEWICSVCGQNTYQTDMDYLVGYDHLSCHLKSIEKNTKMKIRNWEKIRGCTYKGYCIVNPIHNADETKYSADVINLNLIQKPVYELSLLTPAHNFMEKNGMFHLYIYNKQSKFSHSKMVTKVEINSIDGFIRQYEKLIDTILDLEEKQKFKPVTGPVNFNMNVTSSLSW